MGGSGGVGGQDTEGGMGSAEGRGYLIVSVGQKAGECGQFLSRVDGMVGVGEGGRSAHVITREDNGLVSLQAASSSNQASSDFLFVFPTICPPSTTTVCCYTQIIK